MLLNGVKWYSSNHIHCAEFLPNYSRNVLWHMKPETHIIHNSPPLDPMLTSWIQSAICSTDSFRSNILLSLHLCLGLLSDASSSGFFSDQKCMHFLSLLWVLHAQQSHCAPTRTISPDFRWEQNKDSKPQLLCFVCKHTSLPSMKRVAPSQNDNLYISFTTYMEANIFPHIIFFCTSSLLCVSGSLSPRHGASSGCG